MMGVRYAYAEYLEPLDAFQRGCVRDTIVFFGSARLAPDGPYYEAARELTVTPCLAAPCRLIRDTNLEQVSAGMAWHYEHPSASKPARIGSDTPRTKMRRARGVAGCGLIRPRCRHGIVGCVID